MHKGEREWKNKNNSNNSNNSNNNMKKQKQSESRQLNPRKSPGPHTHTTKEGKENGQDNARNNPQPQPPRLGCFSFVFALSLSFFLCFVSSVLFGRSVPAAAVAAVVLRRPHSFFCAVPWSRARLFFSLFPLFRSPPTPKSRFLGFTRFVPFLPIGIPLAHNSTQGEGLTTPTTRGRMPPSPPTACTDNRTRFIIFLFYHNKTRHLVYMCVCRVLAHHTGRDIKEKTLPN
jgi:hypothetical protein